MTLETLQTVDKVMGLKQVTKAVKKGRATCVFLAGDADTKVVEPLKSLCEQENVNVVIVATMKELGDACSLEVGTATAAALK